MNDSGFLHFLVQSDWIARATLAFLILMSIAAWSLTLLKAYQYWVGRGRRHRFRAAYAACGDGRAIDELCRLDRGGAMAQVASAGLAARARWRQGRCPDLTTDFADFLDRALHRALLAERCRAEEGLPLLASVASTAPFVGLFGTVWGIYHALLAIAATGQAGLDRVAGPVGEALTMTAIGLAVAIPATLAYNALVRATRAESADLEDFSHEWHAYLSTAVPADPRPVPIARETIPGTAEVA